MTTEEFIQTTQPIVDIIKAVVKIRHGEFSKHYNIIITSVLDAQSKKERYKMGNYFKTWDEVSQYSRKIREFFKERIE